MALGNIITPEVKDIIVEVWRSHLENGWTAKEIQAEVAKRVQEKWPGKYNPDWPGLRAVQNKIREILDAYKYYEKLYEPWNMGMLDTYPVPAEALPIIIEVQKWADACMKIKEQVSEARTQWLEWNNFDISIRQVHWIARLYTFVNWYWYKATKNKKAKEWALRFLWTWSKAYMYQELICWLAGKTLDTTNLDKALRDGWGAQIMGPYYLLFPKDGKWPEIAGISVYRGDDSIIDIIKREKDGAK